MSKIIFKPAGAANTHSVFKDGKLVGEFRFIRARGGIATAGILSDFTSNGEYDLSCFAYFKDVKRRIAAHYTSTAAARLNPVAYLVGLTRFQKGDTVRLKKKVADGDKRPATVEILYSDIHGGLRLNEERNGFVSWNVADLEKVPA